MGLFRSLTVLIWISVFGGSTFCKEYDVIVYGATAGGVMASIAAADEGMTVLLVEPGKYVGGMVTGGLSHTDYGDRTVIGGLAYEFYKKVGFNYALSLHYNPHNQFLHTFLTLGVFGVTLLIYLFWTSLVSSIRKKDVIMLLFLISFLLFSMSESTLSVNKGIVFFSVLLSFFSYLPKKSSYYLNETSNH